MKVGVIGAGSLGTALSQTISENVDQLLLHVRKQELCDDINNMGYNTHYYPNRKLKNWQRHKENPNAETIIGK